MSLIGFNQVFETVVPSTSETHYRYYPHLTRGEAAGHIPRRGGGLGVGQTYNCLRSRQVSWW